MLVGVAVAAFAVDLGSLHLERRAMQGAADLAAIAAARDIAHAERAARATLDANGLAEAALTKLERGAYAPDAKVPAERRFIAGKRPYNAVRLAVHKPGVLFFAKALLPKPPTIGVAATTATSSVAAFSIGSRLAAVRDGLFNQLLSGLLGGNVTLTAMDYNALLNTDIDMFEFLDALAANMNVKAGTYQDVLQSKATVGDALAAAAQVSEKSGNAQAQAALEALSRQSNAANLAVPLSTLINLGPLAGVDLGDPAPGLDAKFKAMDLVSGAAAIANGEHQVAVNIASGIPGILSLKLDVAIGEPAPFSGWVAVGEPGATVRTAQTRLRLIAEIAGNGLLLGAKVRLPILINAAYAEGRLAAVNCAVIGAEAVDVAVKPGVAEAWIGEVTGQDMSNLASKPAVAKSTIVSTPLAKITGSAHAEIGAASETTLSFSRSDIDAGAVKRVASTNLSQSLVTSLTKDLKLNVQVLGLGLGLPSALSGAISSTLAPVAAQLNSVVDALLQTLGVRLGEADVKVHGVSCGGSMLTG